MAASLIAPSLGASDRAATPSLEHEHIPAFNTVASGCGRIICSCGWKSRVSCDGDDVNVYAEHSVHVTGSPQCSPDGRLSEGHAVYTPTPGSLHQRDDEQMPRDGGVNMHVRSVWRGFICIWLFFTALAYCWSWLHYDPAVVAYDINSLVLPPLLGAALAMAIETLSATSARRRSLSARGALSEASRTGVGIRVPGGESPSLMTQTTLKAPRHP